MQQTEMTKRLLRITNNMLLIRRRNETSNELQQEAQILALLCTPRSRRLSIHSFILATTITQIEIFTNDFNKVRLFEEALIRRVALKQVNEEIQTVLDYNPAAKNISLAIDDFHYPVETRLKSHDFLDVSVRFSQVYQQYNRLNIVPIRIIHYLLIYRCVYYVISDDFTAIVEQIDESWDTAWNLKNLLLWEAL